MPPTDPVRDATSSSYTLILAPGCGTNKAATMIDSVLAGYQQCYREYDCRLSGLSKPSPIQPQRADYQQNKPSRPFQEIAGDLCYHVAQNYLILIDCCTDWPNIIPMGHDTTTSHLVNAIRWSFCCTKAPGIFWSDEEPQFKSKSFSEFTTKWGFHHSTSTPRYPRYP